MKKTFLALTLLVGGMSLQATTFTRMTDPSQLSVGSQIIITNGDGTKAMGKQAVVNGATQQYFSCVDVTPVGNDIVLNENSGVEIVTLESSGKKWPYLLKTSEGYLHPTTSTTKATLVATSESSETGVTIFELEEGNTNIHLDNTNYCYIKYNPSSPRFSTYKKTAAGSVAVYIKQDEASVEAPQAPVISLNGESVTDITSPISAIQGNEVNVYSSGATNIVMTENGSSSTVANPYTFTLETTGTQVYSFVGQNTIGSSESVSVTFNVAEKQVDKNMLFNFAEPSTLNPIIIPAGVSAGVQIAGNTYTNGNYTCAFAKEDNNTNGVKLWTKTGNVTEVRMYNVSTVTITTTETALPSLEFEGAGDFYPTSSTGSFNDRKWTPSSPVQSLTITTQDKKQIRFSAIKKTDTATEVINLASDTEEVEYFDLMGRKITNPQHGIFIKRVGNNTFKVRK